MDQVYSDAETNYLLESVKLPEVREELHLFLREITQPHEVQCKLCFQRLGWFCYALLEQVSRTDFDCLVSLMNLCVLVQRQEQMMKFKLAQEVSMHQMWRKKGFWRECLNH